VFPDGHHPEWTLAGTRVGDFWAPEMARVGDEYWLTYTARRRDHACRSGLPKASTRTARGATMASPAGGGVIDAHIFIDEDGAPTLFWKEDRNGLWPRPLAAAAGAARADRRHVRHRARPPHRRLRRRDPAVGEQAPADGALLPDAAADQRRAGQLAAGPGGRSRGRLQDALLDAMRTPIFAQRLASDGASLVGERVQLLENDQPWEGHLIEGPWVTRQQGRYWMFYAGNDFTNPAYGIGVAVADDLLGPYVKQPQPLLRSTSEWLAPGHASVAPGLDGEAATVLPRLSPGTGGYNAFRALLTVGAKPVTSSTPPSGGITRSIATIRSIIVPVAAARIGISVERLPSAGSAPPRCPCPKAFTSPRRRCSGRAPCIITRTRPEFGLNRL
jgi:arabinan endo-1,5-alpha-L-arabinosidase